MKQTKKLCPTASTLPCLNLWTCVKPLFLLFQNKVSSVTFQSGPNSEELYKLRTIDVESRATGWFSCTITGLWSTFLCTHTIYHPNWPKIHQVLLLIDMQLVYMYFYHLFNILFQLLFNHQGFCGKVLRVDRMMVLLMDNAIKDLWGSSLSLFTRSV